MDQQKPWGLPGLNEFLEVLGHGTYVSGDEDTSRFGGDPQNTRVRRAIRYHAECTAKVEGRLAAPESSSDSGIQIGVRLKSKAQDRRTDGPRLARSKRSTMSGGSGLLAWKVFHLSSCAFR